MIGQKHSQGQERLLTASSCKLMKLPLPLLPAVGGCPRRPGSMGRGKLGRPELDESCDEASDRPLSVRGSVWLRPEWCEKLSTTEAEAAAAAAAAPLCASDDDDDEADSDGVGAAGLDFLRIPTGLTTLRAIDGVGGLTGSGGGERTRPAVSSGGVGDFPEPVSVHTGQTQLDASGGVHTVQHSSKLCTSSHFLSSSINYRNLPTQVKPKAKHELAM